MIKLSLRIENSRIAEARFKTFGCDAAIAVSSITTEMLKGKTTEEALQITGPLVAEALGGLPENKLHCSALATQAIQAALKNYQAGQEG